MERIIDIADALVTLRPKAEWSIHGDKLEWLDKKQTQPTDSEIDVEVIRLQAEYDAQAYARNRATAFPSIGDQLDMQYHDQLDGTTTWKDAIAKVKSDNPKE
jgi:hypothetical protein